MGLSPRRKMEPCVRMGRTRWNRLRGDGKLGGARLGLSCPFTLPWGVWHAGGHVEL